MKNDQILDIIASLAVCSNWVGELRTRQVKTTKKNRKGICHRAVSSLFSSLLTDHSALFTSSSPLFFRLRAGHQLFQRPSPKMQFSSNNNQPEHFAWNN
jgi:hypothetical protein